jgi:hypothetical protein
MIALALVLLALPAPPSADRVIVYNPTVGYDVEAPTGLHGTIRLPALPIGHEYPEQFEVEAVLKVTEHPKRDTGGAFTEYRIVGKMVRPVPPVEEDGGEGSDALPGLGLPRPGAVPPRRWAFYYSACGN